MTEKLNSEDNLSQRKKKAGHGRNFTNMFLNLDLFRE